MIYNFDEIINRKNTGSIKYDFAAKRGRPEGLLPLWVADMDFAAPKGVVEELEKAVRHGIFGYAEPMEAYYQALTAWFSGRYGLEFTKEDVVCTPGVVYALAQIVRALTNEGEGVIIQSPVYYPFYSVVEENGRKVVRNPLIFKDGRYTMDFDGLEALAAQEEVKMLLLCSPHNPVGRVWKRDELERLNEICRRNNIIVVADEIHCDFVYSGNKHTSFGLLDENAVICTAPSKTFNLAGLQTANVIVKDTAQRRRLLAEISRSGYSQLNTLGLVACRAAYQHGAEWLAELITYLEQSLALVRDFINERLPKVKLIEPEGTYLIWLDFTAYGLTQKELDRRVIQGAGLWLDTGTMFGREGEGFQRINLTCPHSVLRQALEQLAHEFNK
ncbi:MAG: pyridoxal phosphate-dependent aminotransferase [Oscillospiraceae bacterium]|jgi:cystathionine beta-lyase|nr:pyridoxal phosphate-dependent aminotransferase [Oscillospiraceae bacterium]